MPKDHTLTLKTWKVAILQRRGKQEKSFHFVGVMHELHGIEWNFNVGVL